MNDIDSAVVATPPTVKRIFPRSVRASTLKVTIGLLLIICLLTVVGILIEQPKILSKGLAAVWAALSYLLARGGEILGFWGAASVGCAALGILARVCWVFSRLPKDGNDTAESVSFWYAALGVLAWARWVFSRLSRKGGGKTESVLIWSGVISVVIWLLANFVMQTTFITFHDLTVYQQIAVVVMNAPYVIGALSPMLGLIWVVAYY